MAKQNKHHNIELRSEEVNDILTKVPGWILRWGNPIFLMITLALFALSFFVKYPDIVIGNGKLTTVVPPEKKFVRASGKIDTIFVKDSANVYKNETLAIIQNNANYLDVFYLKTILDSLTISEDIMFPINEIPVLILGDIEQEYAAFENSYIQYRINKNLNPFSSVQQAKNFKEKELQKRLQNVLYQKKVRETELENIKNELDRNTVLFNNGVISAQEFENIQNVYLEAQRSLGDYTEIISGLKEEINKAKHDFTGSEISNIKEEMLMYKKVVQSYNNLKRAIKDWEDTYTVYSNLNGVVYFINRWHNNQSLQTGDYLFAIVPFDASSYIVKLEVPATNSGKLQIGQEVHIALDNYPEQEFGYLKGKVKTITAIPNQSGNYIISAELPENLITSYGKSIFFKQEMSCKVEIITEDLRLIERLINKVRAKTNL